MRSRAALLGLALAVLTASTGGHAQGRRGASAEPAASPTNVRALVGAEAASRLVKSVDPDERLRGIERASAIGSAEAVALLVQAAEPTSPVRTDGRALVALARALAPFADQERVRNALLAITNTGNVGFAGRMPQGRGEGGLSLEDGDPVARADLARHVAAFALGQSRTDRALELLYGAARGGGSGQTAALHALAVFPPRDPGFFGSANAQLPIPVVKLLGELGDLRALERLHGAARSPDPLTRAAAILAIAQLGDERGIALARAAIVERDVRMRAASGEALVLLGAPERVRAVTALVSDEATSMIGVRLAERVFHPEVVKLLLPRAQVHPDAELRLAAIQALGRSPDPAAAIGLTSKPIVDDPKVAYPAALALARSPAPNAGALVAALATSKTTAVRSIGVRAYVVRAMLRGEREGSADEVIARLSGSRDETERSLGVFARIALGDAAAEDTLGDPVVSIRRASVMGAIAHPTNGAERAMLARMGTEPDAVTRQVLATALTGSDGGASIPSNRLLDRAEGGGPDGPLAALALARRADEADAPKIAQLLASKDLLVRAHVALGLGRAALPDATGRLARAYAFETDASVRRAVITALAARVADKDAPSRRTTLEQASRLDPDALVRALAASGLTGNAAPVGAPVKREVAWLRLARDDGSAPGAPFAAALVRPDGLALPIAFDAEGYAIVGDLPPGESRLVLAPRLPRD